VVFVVSLIVSVCEQEQIIKVHKILSVTIFFIILIYLSDSKIGNYTL